MVCKKRLHHIHRRQRAFLAFGILFVILGFGNLVIGKYRINLYNALLRDTQLQYERELNNEKYQSDPVILSPSQEIDRYALHLRQVKSRLDFYRVVEIGGKCFLALSGFLFLSYFLVSRESANQRSDIREEAA